jgi:hypothetical protein
MAVNENPLVPMRDTLMYVSQGNNNSSLPPELRGLSFEQWSRIFCFILTSFHQQAPTNDGTIFEHAVVQSMEANQRKYGYLRKSNPPEYSRIVIEHAIGLLIGSAYDEKDKVIRRHAFWSHVRELPAEPTPPDSRQRQALIEHLFPCVDNIARQSNKTHRQGLAAERAYNAQLEQAALVFGTLSHRTPYACEGGLVQIGDPNYLEVAFRDAQMLSNLNRGLRG